MADQQQRVTRRRNTIASNILTVRRTMQPEAASQPQEDISWEKIDRLDWHLWTLSTLLIFVLGISLLSFMFPSVFWRTPDVELDSSRRAFFGFCTLMGLTLIYLLQRQATVRKLKRRLYTSQLALETAERRAAEEAFSNLPGTDQFRDALAMEYRRASIAQQSLGAAILSVPKKGSEELLGRMAKFLCSTMRSGESLYRISETGLAVVLPRMATNEVAALVARAEKAINLPVDLFDVHGVSYPSEASSLAEMEAKLRKSRSADTEATATRAGAVPRGTMFEGLAAQELSGVRLEFLS